MEVSDQPATGRTGGAAPQASSGVRRLGSFRLHSDSGSFKDKFRRGKHTSSTEAAKRCPEASGSSGQAAHTDDVFGSSTAVEPCIEEESESARSSLQGALRKCSVVSSGDRGRVQRRGLGRTESESTFGSSGAVSFLRGPSFDEEESSSSLCRRDVERKCSGESVNEDNASVLLDCFFPDPAASSREDLPEAGVDEVDKKGVSSEPSAEHEVENLSKTSAEETVALPLRSAGGTREDDGRGARQLPSRKRSSDSNSVPEHSTNDGEVTCLPPDGGEGEDLARGSTVPNRASSDCLQNGTTSSSQ